MLRRTISILGLVLAVSLCPRAASSAEERPFELPEVLISPRRVPGLSVDADSYPGHATVLTRAAIERSGAQTMQELLARQAGMHLLDQQGFGLASDGGVNIRGIINSSRTGALVLVDGVRQNRFTGDEVHWQSLPLDHIERIEIIRGGGGTMYGEGAMAGVINIITRQDGDRPLETDHRLETGTFGWRRAHTGARGRGGPWTYALQATRTLLDGYREFSWSRGTVVNAHTGIELTPGLTSRLHVLHSEDVTAFPGNLTSVQSQQRREGTNSFHGFNTNEDDQLSVDLVAGPVEGLSGVLTAYWRRRTQFSEDSINFNSFTVTPSRGLNLHGNYEAGGEAVRSLLVGGVELLDDKATTGDPGAGEDSQSHRRGYGVFVEETLTLWDRLTLIGGARIDKSRFEESLTFPAFTGSLRFEGWSPKLAATYALVPDRLFAFASFARPYKAPNVDDFSVRT
ncbi:MAG: TonB-dependent receptor, partial [Dehalococcoidia bacterium]|nr:TonB-dependent receptor [Dehalococcoidia bacterium]